MPGIRTLDETTARELVRAHKAGKVAACPFCGSTPKLTPSTDERGENWYIKCQDLRRCGAFGDLIGY